MKYPVGPETLKKASQTDAGMLAALLNRVLYSADTMDVQITEATKCKRWVASREVYKGDDRVPKSVNVDPERTSYFLTEDLMLAIRDHLEWISIKEVSP